MPPHPDRQDRLLALLEADGVGYSRLMAADPPGTLAQLDAARAVFRRHIEAEGGRVVDMAGDSVLAAFVTALSAVQAAKAIQAELNGCGTDLPEDRRLRHRIGIHVGDVIEKSDGSIYGSGVNIAARLESLGPPGGIAVSRAVVDMVHSRLPDLAFRDLGLYEVKNIPDPVRAFAIGGDDVPAPAPRPAPPPAPDAMPPVVVAAALRWRKPLWRALLVALVLGLAGAAAVWVLVQRGALSWGGAKAEQTLAVLPFASRSGDPAHRLFAEGLSDELIGLLGRVQGLRVTARGSSFAFQGKPTAMPEIAAQLGVGWLVDGSVRHEGERVRVSAELIDGRSGRAVWTDSFDRDLKDALQLQQTLAIQLARQLKLRLDEGAMAQSGTRNPDAYRLHLETLSLPGDSLAAVQRRVDGFAKVLQIDPDYADAHVAWAAAQRLLLVRRLQAGDGLGVEMAQTLAPIRAALDRALAIDPAVRGADLVRHDLLLLEGRVAEARRLLDETLAAEPHSALALDRRSTHRLLDLDVPGALDDRRRVINVSPLAPESYSALANYLLLTGDAAGARQAFDKALLLRPNWQAAQVGLVVSLRTLGEQDAAALLARELIARGARSGQLWAAAPAEDRQRLAAQVASRGSLREKAELALAQGSTEPMLGLLERVPTLVADRPYLLFAQRYDRLREEPRFQAWLQREGLADAQARAQTWRATR